MAKGLPGSVGPTRQLFRPPYPSARHPLDAGEAVRRRTDKPPPHLIHTVTRGLTIDIDTEYCDPDVVLDPGRQAARTGAAPWPRRRPRPAPGPRRRHHRCPKHARGRPVLPLRGDRARPPAVGAVVVSRPRRRVVPVQGVRGGAERGSLRTGPGRGGGPGRCGSRRAALSGGRPYDGTLARCRCRGGSRSPRRCSAGCAAYRNRLAGRRAPVVLGDEGGEGDCPRCPSR